MWGDGARSLLLKEELTRLLRLVFLPCVVIMVAHSLTATAAVFGVMTWLTGDSILETTMCAVFAYPAAPDKRWA
jgi:hypothetical protein